MKLQWKSQKWFILPQIVIGSVCGKSKSSRRVIVAKRTGLVIGSLIYYNWHLLNANSLFTENCIKLKGSCLSLAFSRQTLRPCCCPLHTHTKSHIISHAHTLGHGLFVLSGEEVVRACRLVFIAVLFLVCHIKPCTVMLQMSCVETQVLLPQMVVPSSY